MGQVGLALIGAQTTLGIGATLAIQIGASVAFSAIASKKSRSTTGSYGSELYLSGDPNEPRYIVYGRAWTGGVLRYRNSTGTDNRELYLVIVLAGHECQGVDSAQADRETLTLDGSGNVTAPAKWVGRMNVRYVLGTDSQAADSTLDTAFSNWTSNHRLRGCTYAIVKLTFDEENLSSVPSFRFLVKGRKVYDPRLDSTNGGVGAHRLATPSTWEWSENPVLCHNDYARGVMINSIRIAGPGVSTSRFSWANVIAEANVCEENVSLAAGGTEDRYTANGIIDPRSQHGEVREMFEQAIAGDIAFSDGKWRYFAGAYRAPSLALTADHFVGPLRLVVHKGESDRRDTAHGRYSSLAESGTTISYSPVSLSTATTGSERVTGIDMALVNDLNNAAGYDGGARAQRIAKLLLERDQAGKLLTCTTNLYGLRAMPGESISVTHAAFGLSSQTMRVMDVALKPVQDGDKAGLVAELLLGAGPSSIYTWSAEETALGAAPSLLQTPVTPRRVAYGWVEDSQGKPAGIRANAAIADRSQVVLTNGRMRITSTPDTDVSYALPAIAVRGDQSYSIKVRWSSSAASADGLYFWVSERTTSLPTGTTHIGSASTGESVAADEASHTNLLADGPFPGTTAVEETFTYTAPSGVRLISIAWELATPATAGVYLEVEWISFTEVGSNVDLLPWVTTPTDTPDLNPEAATSSYTLTDSDQTNIPDIFSGSYQLEFPSDIDEAHDCDVFATFTCELVAPSGAFLGIEGWVNGTNVSSSASQYFSPVTSGERVSMQFQLSVAAGDNWNARLTAGSISATDADLSDIRWEVNVIRR